MIEKIWLGYSYLYLFLIPFSIFYGMIIGLRRLCYNLKIFSSWKSPIPIIVVGNLTVGGNGKTPVVIWLVEQLLLRGYHVGVVSRGYAGKATSYPLLVNKNISINESGDEPALIYYRTGVPIAVAPKRVEAVKMLLKQKKLNIIITDDGLQHYILQRDFEIIVIDGILRFGNGWLLPAGPLRECKYRLNTVNIIITNGGIAKYGEISMQLIGDIAINMLTGEKRLVYELKQIVAIAGIAHPSRFFLSLEKKGILLTSRHSFSDHQYYKLSKLKNLVTNYQTLLMTEKDAIKCFHFAQLNWWYLPVNANFSKSDTKKILSAITKLVKFNKKI
ncbi:MAG: tetraacyldisaccharide 4'-kinase [Arsenophonus sp. ET-YP4-MAG3]